MNNEKLFANIVDVLEEGQLKLGYREETLRLYYPLASLCAMLGQEADAAGMQATLEEFAAWAKPRLGDIEVTRKKDRFCLAIGPQGLAYVHAQTDENGFLARFLRCISAHGCTIGQLKALFAEYSNDVVCQSVHNGEFDYVLWFADGQPNDFRYCITDEGCHMTYHRFTRADYEAFGF